MTEAEAARVQIGSLVQFTHIGRHKTDESQGLVVGGIRRSGGGRPYADIYWFDGTSHGTHPLLHSNLSLISA